MTVYVSLKCSRLHLRHDVRRYIHTDAAHVLHVYVGLAQARPNYTNLIQTVSVFVYMKHEWHTFSGISVIIANLYVFSSALLYWFQNHIIYTCNKQIALYHVTYLATPQDIAPEGGDNESTTITIPVVLTSNASGEAILVCSGRRASLTVCQTTHPQNLVPPLPLHPSSLLPSFLLTPLSLSPCTPLPPSLHCTPPPSCTLSLLASFLRRGDGTTMQITIQAEIQLSVLLSHTDDDSDSEAQEERQNLCNVAWEVRLLCCLGYHRLSCSNLPLHEFCVGQSPGPLLPGLGFPTDSLAREHLKRYGVKHYWDLALSETIVEQED